MRNESPQIRRCVASLAVCLAACARDSVNLGDEILSEPPAPSASCADDPVIDGDVRVTSQPELDALAGCEEIAGGLTIEVFPGTDLRPLASLRAVGGELFIGRPSTSLRAADMDALIEAGWLASFEGLEALERAGSLALMNFAASDLSPFSSLRYVNAAAPESRVRAGDLGIGYAKNLVDLRGLERIAGISSLSLLETPALESLEGLTLSYRFGFISIQKAPRLKNIDALAPLERGDGLVIIDTGVDDLSALSSLESVQYLSISDNALLADVSTILNPAATLLAISGNPKLRGTLELKAHSLSSSISIADNPELEGLSFNDREQHTIPWTGGSIAIYRNAKLRTVTSPNGSDHLDSVEVVDNPSLEALDLGRLWRLDELHIRNNPRLFALSHAEFERIYVVDVVNNPLLSPASLASVPAFERTLEGNAD